MLLCPLYHQSYLLDALEVPDGGAEEESERHVNGVGEAEPPFLLVADEVYHHVCLEVADGDHDFLLHDDAEWYGGEGCPSAARLLLVVVWDAEDYHYPSVLVLVSGALVGIGDIAEEVVGDVQLVVEILHVLGGGAGDLYPAVRLPCLEHV